jgi:hypothetical protein
VRGLTGDLSGEDGWGGETSDERAPTVSDSEEGSGARQRLRAGPRPREGARGGKDGPAGNRASRPKWREVKAGKEFVFLFHI